MILESVFSKEKEKEKKLQISGFSGAMQLGGFGDTVQQIEKRSLQMEFEEVCSTEEDHKPFEEANDVDHVLFYLERSSVAKNNILGHSALKNGSVSLTYRRKGS